MHACMQGLPTILQLPRLPSAAPAALSQEGLVGLIGPRPAASPPAVQHADVYADAGREVHALLLALAAAGNSKRSW